MDSGGGLPQDLTVKVFSSRFKSFRFFGFSLSLPSCRLQFDPKVGDILESFRIDPPFYAINDCLQNRFRFRIEWPYSSVFLMVNREAYIISPRVLSWPCLSISGLKLLTWRYELDIWLIFFLVSPTLLAPFVLTLPWLFSARRIPRGKISFSPLLQRLVTSDDCHSSQLMINRIVEILPRNSRISFFPNLYKAFYSSSGKAEKFYTCWTFATAVFDKRR